MPKIAKVVFAYKYFKGETGQNKTETILQITVGQARRGRMDKEGSRGITENSRFSSITII